MQIAYACPLPARFDSRFCRPPIGVGCLSAYVEQNIPSIKHDIVSSEDISQSSPDALAKRLLFRSPKIVGLSSYIWNSDVTSQVAKCIKHLSPTTCVVIGGPEATYSPNKVLQQSDADFVCRGEGETPFLSLVASTFQANAVNRCGIAGLMHRNDITQPDIVHFSDFSISPAPHKHLHLENTYWADIETTRGCAFRCGYCLYAKSDHAIRHKSVSRVLAEIRHLKENGVRLISILDPTFNYDPDYCRHLCDQIAAINSDRSLAFSVEARAELIDAKMGLSFARAGIVEVEVGLQSTNRESLSLMRRGFSTAHFVQGCHELKKNNIGINIGVIIGLPGDDKRSCENTIKFAKDAGSGRISIYRLQVLPGSHFQMNASTLGITYDHDPPYYVRATGNMKKSEIDDLLTSNRPAGKSSDTKGISQKTNKLICQCQNLGKKGKAA